MNTKRLALASLCSAVLVTLLAQPAAAQSVSAELIYGLNEKLLVIAIPITLLVEGILIYAVLKFRNNDEPKPTKENRRLEITWTLATAVILLFVGVASYGVMAQDTVEFTGGEEEIAPDENDVLVEANAYQWGWNMHYPEQDIWANGTGAGPTVVVPANQDVYIQVASDDVIHGFHVPELGLKTDAIPGQPNYLKTNISETGSYQGYCSEYCGLAHSNMYFTIEVVDQAEYDQWVAEQSSGDA
ncbi:cytochrome c oxidase subunit II [Halonotius terrestris]|uniref:cytochrome-c oxidase n=1 Tax=Halonotius terrestris TaxID=2487750 RepID=A0A8J8PF41_9EURY|nr:cytochrome c oxidase subunit II [Halonotius terrestris]TQQ83522.1 cytochrome c oxidase subunit II [Halonotius terrestris]